MTIKAWAILGLIIVGGLIANKATAEINEGEFNPAIVYHYDGVKKVVNFCVIPNPDQPLILLCHELPAKIFRQVQEICVADPQAGLLKCGEHSGI